MAPTTTTALRRVVRRMLFLVGGAIAGTAIAWAISSATASAEASCAASPVPPVPGLSDLVSAGQRALQPVDDGVCAVAHAVPVPSRLDTITRATGDINRTVTDWSGRTLPNPLGDLAGGDAAPEQQAPDEHVPASPPRSVGEPSTAGPVPTIDDHSDTTAVAAAATPLDRAVADRMSYRVPGRAAAGEASRRGSPAPAPFVPREPAPMPAAPAPGSTGFPGSGADSPAYVTPLWTCAQLGTTGRQLPPAGGLALAGEAGTQPGVTPD